MLSAGDPRYAVGFGEARASLCGEAERFFTSFRMTIENITDFSKHSLRFRIFI